MPSGSVTLLKLTEAGKTLTESLGLKLKNLPKNGSLQHEYYKEMVDREYESKEHQVVAEYPLGGGKAIDLVAMKGDEKIASEIETGKSDAKENVRKCKKAGFENVKVVKI